MNNLPKEFCFYPSVFTVEDEYQIIIITKKELLMWVRIGDNEYFDDTNGIIRSSSPIHKIIVPKSVLDGAGVYTVCFYEVIKRTPYCTKTKSKKEFTFSFKGGKTGGDIKIFHISDTHGRVKEAIEAGIYAGEIDLLIFNGDIANHSGNMKNIKMVYEIASGITKGEIPCVFSRGNHDTRGKFAEFLADYTPTDNGKSYYTFSVGDLWGMVVDCGEDKLDSDIEYGNTVCCHNFRLRETEFIKTVAESKKYDSFKHKLVVCHMPFTFSTAESEKFNIENDIYDNWSKIISDDICPNLYLYGHTHTTELVLSGEHKKERTQNCPAIIGGKPKDFSENEGCSGTLVSFENEKITVEFVDNKGNRQKVM